MKAIYYFDIDLGYCPVKKYLEQYAPKDKDTQKQINKKINLLSNIDGKIRYVVGNNGMPTPPISFPLDKMYDFFEIKHRKNQDIVIRIFYFRYDDKIVLLNALEKPDNYNTEKENKKINKQLEMTKEFQNRFTNNPQSYEEYN